jgi:hypothetical protein
MTQVSKTAQVARFFAQQYGAPGIPRKRLVKLAYMADVLARQYLGRPITDLQYIKDHYGPNARELEDYTRELVTAEMADEFTQRSDGIRWIRLQARGQTGPFDFTLGETEILGYVTENYLEMEMDEFVELVVKTTDPFTQVAREGDPLPMEIVNNTVRTAIGFDLERLALAERQATEGDYITLAQFVNGVRARPAS